MNKEIWVDRSFEVEIAGLTFLIPVQAGVTVSHETFAYHNGLGDLASGGSVSVEIDSLTIDWDEAFVIDDLSYLSACKPHRHHQPEIKKMLEHMIEAFAESQAAAFSD